MEFTVIPKDLEMPDLLDSDGFLRIIGAEEYDRIPWLNLRAFCHTYARYGLPTTELMWWLNGQMRGRKAIEIGAGAGDLANALAIPATDNRMQEWGPIQLHYKLAGQPTIKYPGSVEDLDALEAVAKYKPGVVIASWVSEWIDPNLPIPSTGGNAWGVKEDTIVELGVTYILIGNTKVHGQKRIMAKRHKEYALPFLRSRAHHPEFNRVWIWND